MYVDKLDDNVDEYNNTYHRTIKMKHIDFEVENYDKDCTFKVGNHAKISKYKSIFARGFTPN